MEYFSKILHIDYDESVQSIVERFLALDDHDIIFIIPTGASIFKSTLDLKSLKLAIDDSGKNIVLVSQDIEGMELAEGIGFRVEQEFLELIAPDEGPRKYSADTHDHPRISDILYPPKKEKTGNAGISPLRKIAGQEEDREESADGEEEFKQSEEVKAEQEEGFFSSKYFASGKESPKRKPSFSISVFVSIFVVFAVIVFGFSLMMVLPKATLSITPQKETVVLDLPIKAAISLSEINFETNTIPGQIVKVEQEKEFQFEATGKSTGENRAGGTITIYNEHTPPQSQTLVKTTRFQTADGKIFRATSSVTVPAAKIENGQVVPGSVNVNVAADGTGSGYNIGPSNFTIPGLVGSAKAKTIYGKSSQSMQGGSTGEGQMVTLDDINNAKIKAEQELLESSKNELKEKLPKDLEMTSDAIETKIIEEKISATAGQAVSNFSITLKVSAAAFLFQKEDMQSLIEKNIEIKLMRAKISYKDTRKNYSDISVDFSGGGMSLIAHVEQDIAAYIDVESLKQSIAGKTEEEIKEIILSNNSIEAATVAIKPKFILKKIPNDTDKILITIEN